MADPFLGQIMQVGFNFAPRGWAECNGQLLPIAQNTALFSLLGTTYGGDGRTTFALPDLRGRISKHVGTGPGLAPVSWGQRGGAENVNLSAANIPPLSIACNTGEGEESSPTGRFPAGLTEDVVGFTDTANGSMANGVTGGAGTSFGIQNPYLGVYHVIALVGIFPSRN